MKYQIIGGIIALALTFALGRYSVKTPPAVVSDTTKVVDTTKDQETNKNTIIVKHPDGTETITINEDTKTKTKEEARTDAHVEITPAPRKTLNVSALAGVDIRQKSAVYGVAVNKEVLGSITVGVWGFTNGTVGVSVGVSF